MLFKLFWVLAKILWFLVRILTAGVFRLIGLCLLWAKNGNSGRTAVYVRRDWNDRRIGKVRWSDLENPRWDNVSGGTQIESRRPFVFAYVWCNKVQGDIAHSCLHGPAPHNVKVCIMKRDNSAKVWNRVSRMVGPERSYNRR